MIPLDDAEREWYAWLVRELLNALLITSSDELRAAIVLELDELLLELLARCQ